MIGEVLRPPTLMAATADRIREAIFRGELRLGSALREVEVSEHLKVSRLTMREALRLLQAEGLVEIFAHRGAFVTTLSARTIDELYSYRALLEPYAVRLAMENHRYSAEDLAELERLTQQYREPSRDIFERSKDELEFHHRLCKPCDHLLLLQTLKNLESLTRLCTLNCPVDVCSLPADKLYHVKILESIRLGDPVHAAEVVREHIEHSRVILLEGLGSRAEDARAVSVSFEPGAP